MKLCIIGLDCLEPSLVTRWIDDLPTFARLRNLGAWGRMRSCIPPITVPAWSCMVSGRDPGALGIYGFRNRSGFAYDALEFATSEWVKRDRLWDIFSAAGKSCAVIGVPGTYPVQRVNGVMISDFLTPSLENAWTHPPEFKEQVGSWLGGEDYLFDVRDFRSGDKARILADIREMTSRRFTVAREILASRNPDFFMMVEMGSDRIHHAFWHYMDAEHRRHENSPEFSSAIHDYYVQLDRELERLLDLVNLGDTTVMIVSDHGAKRLDGGICVNEWLRKEGYLVLKSEPVGPATPLAKCEVDWSRTTAWAEGGYYARVFLNVKGREPQGIVEPGAYERTRGDLGHHLEQIRDDRGEPLKTVSYKPQRIYPRVEGIAPDLITIFGDLNWRAAGTLGWNALHIFENDTGPDEANHAQEGYFNLIIPGEPAVEGGRLVDILDIAPTLLSAAGISIPREMQGHVASFQPEPAGESAASAAPGAPSAESTASPAAPGYTKEETAEIEKRLAALGYLE
jgi:predicted AlkP superfamily phosphohydrolase/phosphomutase